MHESEDPISARLSERQFLNAIGVVAVDGHSLGVAFDQAIPRDGVPTSRKLLRSEKIPHALAPSVLDNERHGLRLIERERHRHDNRLVGLRC